MTGRELYENHREIFQSMGLLAMPWEALSPMRQAGWDLTAAEYVKKQLDDREDDDDSGQ